jgi:predicted MFS family arabinose efflux permease
LAQASVRWSAGSRPHVRQATMLGIVTAGISAGILVGRIVGGWLAEAIGWRGMLTVFAAACAAVAVGLLLVMPGTRGGAERGYLATLRSIPGLFGRYAALRLAANRGALCSLRSVRCGLG